MHVSNEVSSRGRSVSRVGHEVNSTFPMHQARDDILPRHASVDRYTDRYLLIMLLITLFLTSGCHNVYPLFKLRGQLRIDVDILSKRNLSYNFRCNKPQSK